MWKKDNLHASPISINLSWRYIDEQSLYYIFLWISRANIISGTFVHIPCAFNKQAINHCYFCFNTAIYTHIYTFDLKAYSIRWNVVKYFWNNLWWIPTFVRSWIEFKELPFASSNWKIMFVKFCLTSHKKLNGRLCVRAGVCVYIRTELSALCAKWACTYRVIQSPNSCLHTVRSYS